ncbi:MAG: hypothetical protein R3330_00570, partial [Saprospiraceae bacterium]|nr:hypothetical protein [Saprospiraceae bacterium]
MKRICLAIGIAATCLLQSHAQSRSQLNPKTGLAVLRLADEQNANDALKYFGHTYGLDGMVVESWFYLMTGMHYQRVALAGTGLAQPFRSRANFHQFHVPLHLGVSLPAS